MNVKSAVYSSLMASFMIVLGQVPPILIPATPVPITIQSLGVMLAGSIMGANRAFFALILFLVITAIGVPTLPGATGGLSAFFMPTTGFILSWPIAAFIIGWLVEKCWQFYNIWIAFLINIFGGIFVVYLIGIPWVAWMAHMSLKFAMLSSITFIPGDLIKAAVASWVAIIIKRNYPVIGVAH